MLSVLNEESFYVYIMSPLTLQYSNLKRATLETGLWLGLWLGLGWKLLWQTPSILAILFAMYEFCSCATEKYW